MAMAIQRTEVSADELKNDKMEHDESKSWNGQAPVRFHPNARLTPSDHMQKSFRSSRQLALYVHIPFCLTKCYFCTFTVVAGSRVNDPLIEQYLAALDVELSEHARRLKAFGTPLRTVQIGGGTPSMLSAMQLDDLIRSIVSRFDSSMLEEIVIEGFPTSITPEKLDVLASWKIVKFNVGVQTFNDAVLTILGRSHERKEAIAAIQDVVRAGFPSAGLDLIYGLPGGSVRQVISDVEQVAVLGVDHVALYPLWVYPRTTLANFCRAERIALPERAERAEQLEAASDMLERLGYIQYTAFHYCRRPEARHLYGMWQMLDRDWLGVGQGAVSYLNGTVYQNEARIDRYIAAIRERRDCVVASKRLDMSERKRRAMAYGCRLVPFQDRDFRAKYGVSFDEAFAMELSEFERAGLIERSPGTIRLTSRGILELGKMEEAFGEKQDA